MSGFELIIILLVALLVIGPKRLPQVAKTCGRYVRYMKNFVRHAQAQMTHGDLHSTDKTPPKKDEPADE